MVAIGSVEELLELSGRPIRQRKDFNFILLMLLFIVCFILSYFTSLRFCWLDGSVAVRDVSWLMMSLFLLHCHNTLLSSSSFTTRVKRSDPSLWYQIFRTFVQLSLISKTVFDAIAGVRVTDLHKEHVDQITIPSKEGTYLYTRHYLMLHEIIKMDTSLFSLYDKE